VLFVLFDPVTTDFSAISAFASERTITFKRRNVYLLLMPMPFIPASGESLDLRYVIAHLVKIGAV